MRMSLRSDTATLLIAILLFQLDDAPADSSTGVPAAAAAKAAVAAGGPESFAAALAGIRLHGGGGDTAIYSVDGSGVLTRLWVTNADERVWFGIFVDGETKASLEFNLFEAIGIGFETGLFAGGAPYGNALFGKIDGGCYINIQIPFGNGLRITSRLDASMPAPSEYPSNRELYIQVRGLKDVVGVMSGSLTLPSSTRLKLYRQSEIVLRPAEFVPVLNTTNAGALVLTSMYVSSLTTDWEEGCLRFAFGDSARSGATAAPPLSTGFEDYFSSAYGFMAAPNSPVGAPVYHTADAGMSHFNLEQVASFPSPKFHCNGTNGECHVAAYKLHTHDPLVWQQPGATMWWRNGETRSDVARGAQFKKCDSPYTTTLIGNVTNTTLTSYVWAYEWPATQAAQWGRPTDAVEHDVLLKKTMQGVG